MPPKTTCLFVDENLVVCESSRNTDPEKMLRDDFDETNENYASGRYKL